MSEARPPTPPKQRTCGFCLFKLPSTNPFIEDANNSNWEIGSLSLSDIWLRYIEQQDDWINSQLELTNGDLRDLGNRECENCSVNDGCGRCISNSQATVPFLRESNYSDDSNASNVSDEEASSLREDIPSLGERTSSPEVGIPSFNEDTLGDNRLGLYEDLPSPEGDILSSEEHISTQDLGAYLDSEYDQNRFRLLALQALAKRGCETRWKLLQYLIPFLNLCRYRVNDGVLFWHKGELRWRFVEEEEQRTRYHERSFNIFSVGEKQEQVHPLEKALLNLPNETNSLATFDQLLAWCQTCTDNHPRYSPGSNTALPDRVLYIKPGLEEPNIRLIDRTGNMGKCICLSHYWGPPGSTQPHASLSQTSHHLRKEYNGNSYPRPSKMFSLSPADLG
ncbi:hypothetical protein G7Y89_g8738 [Cudoniella acicularis]|uniref:Uncharacterized protein n=1 Tax=Cudoniella acicularis TaxID=354080 RepID=A0A8H4RIB1_9HELO|nr:hypothetical protein G7Y89_g8738 [Cudoniella acicularis]